MNKKDILVGIILVAIIIVSRALIDIPNVAAVAAVALFSGYYFGVKKGLLIPLIGMILTDVFIFGVYDVWVMVSVYVAFTIPVLLGTKHLSIVKNLKFNFGLNIISKSLAGSLFFFLVTNFAVWASTPMYPANFAGVLECYVAAVPFFRVTWLGDLLFNASIFGAYFIVSTTIWKEKMALEPKKVL